MITRRNMLSSAAVTLPVIALAGCATFPAPGQIGTTVIDYIQGAVNVVAQYIPTAESIAALAASLFGPQWVALVQIGSSYINTLIQYLQSLKPLASIRLRAVPRRTVIAIGVINGVQITGYR